MSHNTRRSRVEKLVRLHSDLSRRFLIGRASPMVCVCALGACRLGDTSTVTDTEARGDAIVATRDGGIGGPDDAGDNQEAASLEPAICQRPHASGRHDLTLNVEGTDRRAIIYVPQGYDGTTRLPLVFNLHPSSGAPEGQLTETGMESQADTRQFFIVALAGYNNLWNVLRRPDLPDDVDFANAVLEWTEANLCTDVARVYSTGFSGGARTSSLLGCALPSRFSAIAPVAGIRNDPPCDATGVNVLALHGTGDNVNFYAGCPVNDTGCSRNGEWGESVEQALGDFRVLNGCRAEPSVEVLPAGTEHHTWSGCKTGATVEFYRVPDGQHTWGLLGAETTTVVLDFLLSH